MKPPPLSDADVYSVCAMCVCDKSFAGPGLFGSEMGGALYIDVHDMNIAGKIKAYSASLGRFSDRTSLTSFVAANRDGIVAVVNEFFVEGLEETFPISDLYGALDVLPASLISSKPQELLMRVLDGPVFHMKPEIITAQLMGMFEMLDEGSSSIQNAQETLRRAGQVCITISLLAKAKGVRCFTEKEFVKFLVIIYGESLLTKHALPCFVKAMYHDPVMAKECPREYCFEIMGCALLMHDNPSLVHHQRMLHLGVSAACVFLDHNESVKDVGYIKEWGMLVTRLQEVLVYMADHQPEDPIVKGVVSVYTKLIEWAQSTRLVRAMLNSNGVYDAVDTFS